MTRRPTCRCARHGDAFLRQAGEGRRRARRREARSLARSGERRRRAHDRPRRPPLRRPRCRYRRLRHRAAQDAERRRGAERDRPLRLRGAGSGESRGDRSPRRAAVRRRACARSSPRRGTHRRRGREVLRARAAGAEQRGAVAEDRAHRRAPPLAGDRRDRAQEIAGRRSALLVSPAEGVRRRGEQRQGRRGERAARGADGVGRRRRFLDVRGRGRGDLGRHEGDARRARARRPAHGADGQVRPRPRAALRQGARGADRGAERDSRGVGKYRAINARMIVTAKLTFSAAHRLNNPKYDAEWNRRTYDKCDNPRGHGHNYTIQVSVKGKVDPETGMVIDLKKLKDIVRARVVDRVDHTNLNEDVDFLRGVIPTAENLARAFWQQLAGTIADGELYEVALQETEKNSVVYRGEDER